MGGVGEGLREGREWRDSVGDVGERRCVGGTRETSSSSWFWALCKQ